MTNIDRAAEVIEERIDRAEGLDRPAQEAAPAAAHALAAKGLLMPDLPEPYAMGLTSGPRDLSDHLNGVDHQECRYALFATPTHPDGTAAYGDRVEITHTIVPDRLGYAPDQARALAAALLAAADHAERNQK